MITIKHNRATLTVKPEHAQTTYDLLALIDKTKGKKGANLPRPKAIRRKYDSGLRSYPKFYSGMSTADYISAYVALNNQFFVGNYDDDKMSYYVHADRRAPELDPTVPEVIQGEILCEQ
jgi:hypothetical protein